MVGRILRGALNLAGGLVLALLVGSVVGALHPAGDSLAVFRTWMVLGALVLAVALRLLASRVLGTVLAASAAGLGLPIALATFLPLTDVAEPDLTIYLKNLNFRLATPEAVLEDIRAADPDIVFLQELTDATEASVIDPLGRAYARIRCPFAAIGDVAILTRLPVVEGSERCEPGRGLVAVQVEGPEAPVWLVSIHLHWPYPYGQAAQVDDLVPLLEALEGPVILGGDFNMVPWSRTVGRIARATGTRVLGPSEGTRFVFHPLLDLPIDHVLAPGEGSVIYRPRLGSDHEGVVARIDL